MNTLRTTLGPGPTRPDVLRQRSEVEARPRFEGTNIGTWIGFKHVLYLVEEAVLDHLRLGGLGPRVLYEQDGLAVELVDCDARILHALKIDDLVTSRVEPELPDGGELTFTVTSYVDRESAGGWSPVKAVSARVRAALRRCGHASARPELAAYAVDAIDRRGPVGNGRRQVVTTDANAFVWRWRVPYFYCHFSQRLQHSGYVRLMEEVVDLFLAERGISIRTMLDGKSWIPVVPQVRVEVLGEALMEEELYTVFTVEEVFKDFTYTARMDCYVPRGGVFLPTATGRITHGYATVVSPRDWRLVQMDPATIRALRGPGSAVPVNGRGSRS